MRKSVFRVIIIVLGIVALATIGILWYKEWNAKKDFLTPMPELTATLEPTATNTPTPEPTATNTPTPEPTATNTPTPEPTATNTPTPKPTATNTPTPKPTATNTPTPTPETLPFTKDGKIFVDGRENPNYLEECALFIPNEYQPTKEYNKRWRTTIKYANYLPIIGEIETYFPGFEEDGKRSGILYDGGVYYIHRNSVAEEDLSWNLASVVTELVPYGDGGLGSISFGKNDDLPYEEGIRYAGIISKGTLHVVRFFIYYID